MRRYRSVPMRAQSGCWPGRPRVSLLADTSWSCGVSWRGCSRRILEPRWLSSGPTGSVLTLRRLADVVWRGTGTGFAEAGSLAGVLGLANLPAEIVRHTGIVPGRRCPFVRGGRGGLLGLLGRGFVEDRGFEGISSVFCVGSSAWGPVRRRVLRHGSFQGGRFRRGRLRGPSPFGSPVRNSLERGTREVRRAGFPGR